MAAISYDSRAVLESFAKRKGIVIPLLSDPESRTIDTFGIRNESIPKSSPFYGVPHPVTYIVGPDGTVQTVFREDDYTRRFTTGAILAETAPGSEAVAGRNGRLELTTSASDTVVRGGERVRLFVNVALAPRVHVYAPGVEGYIPVEWKMESGGTAEVLAPAFPKSTSMRLEAIGETVPVFHGRFLISRDVVIPQPKAVEQLLDSERRLTLRGTFRYQACDDRKCYVPEEVPVVWKFRYEPHDATRVPAELRRK